MYKQFGSVLIIMMMSISLSAQIISYKYSPEVNLSLGYANFTGQEGIQAGINGFFPFSSERIPWGCPSRGETDHDFTMSRLGADVYLSGGNHLNTDHKFWSADLNIKYRFVLAEGLAIGISAGASYFNTPDQIEFHNAENFNGDEYNEGERLSMFGINAKIPLEYFLSDHVFIGTVASYSSFFMDPGFNQLSFSIKAGYKF